MSFKRIFIVSALMILTMVCLRYISHGENILPNKSFSTFPKQIGEWVGKEEHFDKRIYDIVGVDDSILSNYHTSDGQQVQLYVGFYRSQREGDLIHSPKHCMPGAGWNIIRTSIEELIIPNHNPGKIKCIKLILQKGTQRQVVLYWFQSRGRFISSEYMQKIYLVIDSIIKHRTDGSFVRLIAPVERDNEGEALEAIKDFAKLLIPILQEYIPS
ncbi:MAG: EpsI family protein [Deltaproteobacteria bacterium]|nr:EpsI family protein [Deltaproteobacteria bacterium]